MKRRTTVLFLILLAALTSVGHARKVEITPLASYVWTSRIGVYWDTRSGDFDFKNTANWGVAVDIDLHQEAQVELLYNRQDTQLEFYEWPGNIKDVIDDVSVEYFQVGGLYRRQVDQFEPFALFTLGATRYAFKGNSTEHPETAGYGDVWKFSIVFGLGSKLWVSDRIGLRFQGRLLMPMTWSGGGFWCGTGGCGAGVGGTSAMPQFDVGVGLAFRLGD